MNRWDRIGLGLTIGALTVAVATIRTVAVMRSTDGPGTFTPAQTSRMMEIAVQVVEKQDGINDGQLCFAASLQGVDVATSQVIQGYESGRPTGQKHMNKGAVRDYLATMCAVDLAARPL